MKNNQTMKQSNSLQHVYRVTPIAEILLDSH